MMKMRINGSIAGSVASIVLAVNCLAAEPDAANAPVAGRNDATPVRVACVGDSITAGMGTDNPDFQSYPAQLQRMLDSHWAVSNFGVSGATLLNNGDKPYQKEAAFQNVLKLDPDVVVIMLGTNDTKANNWKLKGQFVPDYKDLIEKFKVLASHPRIFICRPIPVPGTGNFGINEAVVKEEIPMIDALARDESVGLIDMHSSLEGKDTLLPDRVHPNAEGAALLAKTVFKALTGRKFAGEVPTIIRSK